MVGVVFGVAFSVLFIGHADAPLVAIVRKFILEFLFMYRCVSGAAIGGNEIIRVSMFAFLAYSSDGIVPS